MSTDDMVTGSSWLPTYTGRRVNPLGLTPDSICIEDIAHGLALQCRFSGQCRVFYSVAQHSVVASRIVSSSRPHNRLAALLHDAGEAYLGDTVRPVKWALKKYTSILTLAEGWAQWVVFRKFGITDWSPEDVKAADNAMLATEARDIVTDSTDDWWLPEPPIKWHIEPAKCWDWRRAEVMFLARFEELMEGSYD